MDLFDNSTKEEGDLKYYSRPKYESLCSSKKGEIVKSRNQINEWFRHYPASDKAEFKSRFQSNRDPQHDGAYFELILHQLLINTTFQLNCTPK